VIEAKSMLDDNITYLSKEAYYKIRDDLLVEGDEEVIQLFKDYKMH
jgi:hypothetical protein